MAENQEYDPVTGYSGEDDEQECGFVYDHDIEEVDEETGQWLCRRCGAEGWDDF